MPLIYNPQGSGGVQSVATVSALPPVGTPGAVYAVQDTGIVYAWSGTLGAWVPQGSTSAFAAANLTEATSSVLTITGGTNAVNGAGTSIAVKKATGSQDGYLGATDFASFASAAAAVPAKAPLASPTFTGTIGTPLTAGRAVVTDGSGNLAASSVTAAILALLVAGENNLGNSTAALTVDLSVSLGQRTTLTANCTITLSNPLSAMAYVLRLIQDGTGSRTVTWPGTVKWAGGAAPTLSTAAGAIDVVTIYFDGTNYTGSALIGVA